MITKSDERAIFAAQMLGMKVGLFTAPEQAARDARTLLTEHLSVADGTPHCPCGYPYTYGNRNHKNIIVCYGCGTPHPNPAEVRLVNKYEEGICLKCAAFGFSPPGKIIFGKCSKCQRPP